MIAAEIRNANEDYAVKDYNNLQDLQKAKPKLIKNLLNNYGDNKGDWQKNDLIVFELPGTKVRGLLTYFFNKTKKLIENILAFSFAVSFTNTLQKNQIMLK